MFTGIITDIGTLLEVDAGRMQIRCGFPPDSIEIGASIACDGCCLTVTKAARDGDDQAYFLVDVSNETLDCTTLGSWKAGQKINLERSLALGAELGGHIVTGHVDGVAQIRETQADGSSMRFTIECPKALSKFIAPKGAVTLNGTSLTINDVSDNLFSVNIIPHTLAVTKWSETQIDDQVNLEVDLLARYVARLLIYERQQ